MEGEFFVRPGFEKNGLLEKKHAFWYYIQDQIVGLCAGPVSTGSTSLLAERGARILGYWPFTYVPLKRLRIQRKPIQTCG